MWLYLGIGPLKRWLTLNEVMWPKPVKWGPSPMGLERPREDTVATFKARIWTSGEATPTDTLILDLPPPGLWEKTFLLLKPLSLWYFAMAILENPRKLIQDLARKINGKGENHCSRGVWKTWRTKYISWAWGSERTSTNGFRAASRCQAGSRLEV